MVSIDSILGKFEPISLKEMDAVKLLNRTDTKYVIHVNDLPKILKEIEEDYFILTIDKRNLFKYESLYFDTADSKMFIAHHNGKLNRYKIRKREYVDSNLNFIEIKFKNNKGRTIKERIRNDKITHSLTPIEKDFVTNNCPYLPDYLEGKLYTIFNRFTLVSKTMQERVTIDLDLSFKDDKYEKGLPFLSIIEVKQSRLGKNSKLTDVLRKNKVLPGSFSKYCFGTALLKENVKTNNFKPRLLKLKKLEYA